MFGAFFQITDPESGIALQRWCFSYTATLACDAWAWVDEPITNASTYIVNITLPPQPQGTHLYFAVCAINGAGAQACYLTNGIMVDMTPPLPFMVIDAPFLPDMQYQSFIDSIVGAALNATDPDSGITEVRSTTTLML